MDETQLDSALAEIKNEIVSQSNEIKRGKMLPNCLLLFICLFCFEFEIWRALTDVIFLNFFLTEQEWVGKVNSMIQTYTQKKTNVSQNIKKLKYALYIVFFSTML